jgi:hypothetical protein
MGKNYPTRSAEGSARHAKKKRVRTYPMDHTPRKKQARRG